MNQMMRYHDDPSIPDGTVVHLPDGAPDNEVAMAIRDRGALTATLSNDTLPPAPGMPDDLFASMWED
jgi:hypothetical protein